jgi:hypothetical protein
VKLIEFYIDLAKECFNIGNFNSMMAIVNGLCTPAVSRLRRTWHRVNTSKLEILQHQLDPSANFVSYRATLKAAIWRAQVNACVHTHAPTRTCTVNESEDSHTVLHVTHQRPSCRASEMCAPSAEWPFELRGAASTVECTRTCTRTDVHDIRRAVAAFYDLANM